MSIDPVLPTSDHPVYDCGTPDLSPDTHRESEDEPDREVDSFYGAIDSPFDTSCLSQDPHRPNALASTDWETITTRTLGVNSPSSQDVLGGMDVFHAVSADYPIRSVSLRTPTLSPRFYTAS